MMTKQQKINTIVCQFLVILALEIVNPFIPSLVQQLTAQSIQQVATISALIIAAPMVGMIIMSPIWGWLGDRVGHKPMLLRASLALALTQLGISFVTSAEQLLVLRLLQGGLAGFIAAMQAYASQTCEWQHRGRVLARLQSAKAIATSFGGLIGGSAILLLGLNNLFLVTSLLATVAFLLIALTLPNTRHTEVQLKTVKTKPPRLTLSLYFIASLILLSQMAKFIPNATFSLYVESLIASNPFWIGLLYSTPGIALFAGSEFCGRLFDRLRLKAHQTQTKRPLITYFLIVGICGLVLTTLHGLSDDLVAIVLIRFGWGLVFASLLPDLFALLGD